MIRRLLTITVLILVIAAMTIAGCTSPSDPSPTPSNSPTATPTSTPTTSPTVKPTPKATPKVTPKATPVPSKKPTPSSGNDYSATLTAKFDEKYVIKKPFSKSTNSNGNVVYSGVVQDGDDKLHPYSHKITIELTKNRDDTKTRYAQYKAFLLSNGLVKEFDYGDYMTFYDGSTYTNPPRQAFLDMNEPSTMNHIYNTGVFVNLGNTFMVTLDDTTRL